MTPRKILRPAALSLALATTAGCSALSSIESASKPLDTYELSALPAGSVTAARSRRILEVSLPTATGALTSDRIVIKPTPLQVEALSNARWVNEATEHVQLLLVRSLVGSGRFALVTSAGSGPPPDYLLLTDLQAFQAEVMSGEVVVVIRTAMTLLRDADGSVVSSRSFINSTTASDTTTEHVVSGFDRAMTQQLRDVVGWLASESGL